MLSAFYQRWYRHILWALALTAPLLWYQAQQIRSNNDIEAWLPRGTEVRQQYEQFKHEFGGEETILLSVSREQVSDELIAGLASRCGRLPTIQACWTAETLQERMAEFGVDESARAERLVGLLVDPSGKTAGILLLLSETGLRDRAAAVDDVRQVLNYCRIPDQAIALTGTPVIITELDRLGNQKAGLKFFLISQGICLALMYLCFGHWGMSLSLLGVSLWAIQLTQALVAVLGGEMNFILGSLAILVLIFTLSISIHLVSYYEQAVEAGDPAPLDRAIRDSLWPCLLSTVTTLFGLISLNVSSILPVAQFGYAAALGSAVAFVVGLAVTPALLMVWPRCTVKSFCGRLSLGGWCAWVQRQRFPILGSCVGLLAIATLGLLRLTSQIDPSDFLPRGSRVLHDLRQVEQNLTNIESIEAVLDFTGRDLAFADQLQQVREFEATARRHPGVRHTFSLATFFPEELATDSMSAIRLLKRAQSAQDSAGLVTADRNVWRVSIRVHGRPPHSPLRTLEDLTAQTTGWPVSWTGVTPLLKSAQSEIFSGFWQSFTMACLTITLVMIFALRSVTAGLVAMVPNIIPIWLVFGGVGFFDLPVDIGMMMTASIALGISVDCTFHFLVFYDQAYRAGKSSYESTKAALLHSGGAMLESTMICGAGMLALCLSDFAPTARFGWLMALQMAASLLGELVILPALLCCRPPRRAKRPLAYVAPSAPALGLVLAEGPQAIRVDADFAMSVAELHPVESVDTVAEPTPLIPPLRVTTTGRGPLVTAEPFASSPVFASTADRPATLPGPHFDRLSTESDGPAATTATKARRRRRRP